MPAFAIASLLATAAVQTVYLPVPQAPDQHVALHCIAPTHVTNRAVLFVHGASFPTMLAAGFSFAPGDSWLAFQARQGYLSCGLDFLGFGDSTRPSAMRGGEEGMPVTRAREAALQIALAVEHLRTVQHMTEVHVVAHSWGTIPAAAYAAAHPHGLDSLTLFGPVTPLGRALATPVHTAWWGITAQRRYQQLRFTDILPPGMVLLEPAVDAAWANRFDASVPYVAGDPPGQLRIPSGPLADSG